MRNYSAVLAVLFAIGVSGEPGRLPNIYDARRARGNKYHLRLWHSGNHIVGTYWASTGNPHGFLYTGSTYTTIDDPLSVGQSNGNVAFSSARNTKALASSSTQYRWVL